MAAFGVGGHSVDVAGRHLGHACAGLRVSCLFGASLFVVLFFEEVLCGTGDLVPGVNIDGLFFEGQAAEGIDQEVIKLLIYIFLDIFAERFKLAFLFEFELVLDVPVGGKDAHIDRGVLLYGLSDHFVLVVESLDGAGDEVVAADEALLVVFVFLVGLPDFCVFLVVGNGGKIESEDSRCLLQQDAYVLLEIVHRQLFVVLLLAFLLVLADFGLGVHFGLATRHEALLLVQRTAVLYLGVVLPDTLGTCELRELFTLT